MLPVQHNDVGVMSGMHDIGT